MADPSRLASPRPRPRTGYISFSFYFTFYSAHNFLFPPRLQSCVCSALAAHENLLYRVPIPPSPLRLLHTLRSYNTIQREIQQSIFGAAVGIIYMQNRQTSKKNVQETIPLLLGAEKIKI
jgi:hypothetical protein